jgi:hypothetical protein
MLKAIEVTCEMEGLYKRHEPREGTTGKALKGLLDKYTPKLNKGIRSAATPASEKGRGWGTPGNCTSSSRP